MKIMNLLVGSIFMLSALLFMQACSGSNETPIDNEEPETEITPGEKEEDEVGFDIENLMNTFWYKTSYTKFDANRLLAMERVQAFADACENTLFKKYYACSDNEEAAMEEGSILSFHSKAVDKILDELSGQKVGKGHIVMWQVYNMGYVVKTPTHVFGIDIKHKHAARFTPYLDFLLITHKHEDHYTTALNEAMAIAGKPVYSNFVDNEYLIKNPKTIQVADDIEVEVKIVDHNKDDLKNFVVTYQIDCGADTNHCILYHVGDACDEEQLTPTQKVDIFIPHLANNLNMINAVEHIIRPQMVLMSHILEMDHPTTKWRWSYQYGFSECQKLNHDKVYLPVWGEKITY